MNITAWAILAAVSALGAGIYAGSYHNVPVNERDTVEELAGSYVDGPCRLELHKDLTYAFTWVDGTTTGTFDIDADAEIAISVHGFTPRHPFPDGKTKYEFTTGPGTMPLYAKRKFGGPVILEIYDETEPVMLERIE
jgi:hypothetical protein